jgi:hypothetical protein
VDLLELPAGLIGRETQNEKGWRFDTKLQPVDSNADEFVRRMIE